MKKFSILVILMTYQLSFAQQYRESDFEQTEAPPKNSTEWSKLNHSNDEFSVEIQKGKLILTKAKYKDKTDLELMEGKLKGVSRGEWGGQLQFVPNNSSKKSIHIKKGNIEFIFKLNNQIYFIEGLAHLSANYGALFHLENNNNNFKYIKIIDFEDAPEAFAINNDKVFIASHSGFYTIDDNIKKEIVFQNMFWSSLYPNSIAVLNDSEVYMGIRSGYIKLNLNNKTFKFYKFKSK